MNKGDIYLVKIPTSNGHEQSGLRPVIVLTQLEANIVMIVPFTSNIQALKYPHTLEIKPSKINGLKNTSIALIFQLRAIDKKRIKSKIGKVTNKTLEKIDEMIKNILLL